MDFIQENLFNNTKKILNRNSKVIYYDCTNYFFKIDEELIKEESKYDGLYALSTNLNADIEDILK